MRRVAGLLPLALVGLSASLAFAQAPYRVVGGNEMYEVNIRTPDHPYFGQAMAGAFTLYTGPTHPLTPPGGRRAAVTAYVPVFNEVAGVSSSSFISIRSYGSATDYLLGINPGYVLDPTPGYTCVLANDVALPSIVPILDAGLTVGAKATWSLRNGGDDLVVDLIARAHGDDFMSSSAELTIRVMNRGVAEARVGVHVVAHIHISAHNSASSHFYRFVGIRPPDPPTTSIYTDEVEFPDPSFRMWQVMRRLLTNPAIDHPPYAIAGAISGPASLDPPPTPPDLMRFTYDNFTTTAPPGWIGEWTYCFDGGLASPPRDLDVGADKYVISVWGHDPVHALIIPPGGDVAVTQHFVAFARYPLEAAAGADIETDCQGAETVVPLLGEARLEQTTVARVYHQWKSDDPAVAFTDPDAASTDAVVTGTGTFRARYTTWVGAYEASDELLITVVDRDPPRIDVAIASPSSLWPPNHRMVEVHVDLTAVDDCDPAPTIRLVDARSNEAALLMPGAGRSTPDMEGWELGTDDRVGFLRAERSGLGRGREYVLVYEVTDAAGNTACRDVIVAVSHDHGKLWQPPAGGSRGTRR